MDKEKFIFSSEVKSIIQVEEVGRTLDCLGINHYFTYGYISDNLSIYKNIKKLKSSEYFELNLSYSGSFRIEKYWSLNLNLNYSLTESEWIDSIDQKFTEAIESHMLSEVPVGAFLSGGIDSSAVVSIMSKLSHYPVKTFSIGFKDKQVSDLPYAKKVSEMHNTEHYEYIVEPESIETLPMLIRNMDEPFADNSIIPTYFVSKFASEHVKFVLSGDGGDELFFGYTIYPLLALISKHNFSSPIINKLLWGSLYSIWPQFVQGKGVMHYLSQNKNYLGAYTSIWKHDERRQLLSKLDPICDSPEKYKVNLINESTGRGFIEKMAELDIRTYMVDDILTKVDKASMLTSLEVRVPILDHEFVEQAFSIPSDLKFKKNEKKYLFKQAIKKYRPQDILTRNKQGFNVPLSTWFKEGLDEYINSIFNNRNSKMYDYLDYKFVKKLHNDHNKGMKNLKRRIWTILVFNEWIETLLVLLLPEIYSLEYLAII